MRNPRSNEKNGWGGELTAASPRGDIVKSSSAEGYFGESFRKIRLLGPGAVLPSKTGLARKIRFG
jgi:hypothetical protein